jgi:hypothetical protein
MKRSDFQTLVSTVLYASTGLRLTMHTTIAEDRILNRFEVWSTSNISSGTSAYFNNLNAAIERANEIQKQLEAECTD